MNTKKRLTKSRDKKVCGVCAGIADYFGIDPALVRILWAVLTLAWGMGLWIYIICAFVLDDAPRISGREQDIIDADAVYVDDGEPIGFDPRK